MSAFRHARLRAAKARGAFHPGLAALTSLTFAAGAFAVAGYEFRHTDY